MQRQTTFSSLIILFLIINELSAGFTQWTANQKYSFAGKVKVNIDQQIVKTGTNWQIPITITVNYPRYLSYSLLHSPIAVIADYGSDFIKLNGIYLFVEASNSSTETAMNIMVKASNASKINKISISYMVFSYVNSTLPNYRNYQLFKSFNQTAHELTKDPSSTHTVFIIINSFNKISATRAVLMIGGLDVDTDGVTSTIDLMFDISIPSSTLLYLKISSSSFFTTYLFKYFVQIIVYNPNDDPNQQPSYRFFDGSIIGNNTNYGYVSNNGMQIGGINTICGLSSFSTSFQESLSFSTSFTSESMIQINAGSNFNFIFTFVAIYSPYCDYKYPYYQSYESKCYSSCPNNFYADSLILQCVCLIVQPLPINNSLCFPTAVENQTTNLSTTIITINEQNQLAIIFGVLLGCTIILFITGILIYCYCYKKIEEDTNKDSIQQEIKFDQNNLKEQIGFTPAENRSKHQKKYNNLDSSQKIIGLSELRLQNQIHIGHIQSPDKMKNQIQQPRFHPKNDNTLQQKDRQKSTMSSSPIWQNCNKYDSSLICSICPHKKCYLQSSCGHFFHISCILVATKQRTGCPKCHKEFTLLAKIYCSGCGQKRIELNLMSIKDINKIQRECYSCRQIPK